MSKNPKSGATFGELVEATPIHPDQLSDAETRAAAERMLGAADGLQLSSLTAEIVRLTQLAAVKKQKVYKVRYSTWADYCGDVLGRSDRSVDEELQGVRELGAAFMALSNQLGVGRATLRTIRQLPESARPKMLESGEIEVEGERLRVDNDHAEEIRGLLEDLVANQQELLTEKEEGRQQLEKLDAENLELRKEVKAVKEKLERKRTPAAQLGITEMDRKLAALNSVVNEIGDELEKMDKDSDEAPDPETVRKWHNVLTESLAKLGYYYSDWRPNLEELEAEAPDMDWSVLDEEE